MRSRLIKALNNRFYVKFMQLEIESCQMDNRPFFMRIKYLQVFIQHLRLILFEDRSKIIVSVESQGIPQ